MRGDEGGRVERWKIDFEVRSEGIRSVKREVSVRMMKEIMWEECGERCGERMLYVGRGCCGGKM